VAVAVEAGVAAPAHVVEIAAGGSYSCARMTDATVRCWGTYIYGLEETDAKLHPELSHPTIIEGAHGAAELSLGGSDQCARFDDRTVWCWGLNYRQELGSAPDGSPLPKQPLTGVTQVVVGDAIYALLADKTVRLLGDSPLEASPGEPPKRTPVPIPRLSQVARLATPGRCAVLEDGSVRCWGVRSRKEDGTAVFDHPERPRANLAHVVELALGNLSCARLADGTVECWQHELDGVPFDAELVRRTGRGRQPFGVRADRRRDRSLLGGQ
jgi:hypothetical protein